MSSLAISSMQRPDASQMASRLFGKLDSKNQGYIEKSDLASALSQLDSTASTDTSSSVDELFSTLDGDGDGKVTESEMTTSMKKLAEELDSQFNSMRMQGGMAGAQGMPPPPPPQGGQGEDSGFSKDELTAQLEEIGSTDSKRSELISNVVNNFDEADADGDGKVTAQEAMAFDQKSSQSATSSGSADSASPGVGVESDSARMLMKIMQLAHAYGLGAQQDDSASSLLNAIG